MATVTDVQPMVLLVLFVAKVNIPVGIGIVTTTLIVVLAVQPFVGLVTVTV